MSTNRVVGGQAFETTVAASLGLAVGSADTAAERRGYNAGSRLRVGFYDSVARPGQTSI